MSKVEFKRFPVGTWGHFPFNVDGMTEKDVVNLAECGVTVMHSPGMNITMKEGALRVIGWCEKYGIQMILRDFDCLWQNYVKLGADGYRALLREHYETFGKSPATIGFFLGDEPHESQLDTCRDAYRIALEEMPGMFIHLNQNPGYAEKCRRFMKESGCNLMSFDRYTQMNEGEEGKNYLINDLIEFGKLAKEADVPMLAVLLAVGHFRYRVPNEDDLRWQMGVSLACGALGIFWYNIYNDIRDANYRGAPISEFGDRSASYAAMQVIHKRFNRDYADLLLNCRHRASACLHKNYASLTGFDAEDPINAEFRVTEAFSERGTPGMISYFDGIGKNAGKKYVMIFNNDMRASDLFALRVPAGMTAYRVFSEGEYDYAVSHPDGWFENNPAEGKFGAFFWLAPGQFEIFRVDRAEQ